MPCTTILVGKKASYDGSTMIARNDDSGAGGYTPKKIRVVLPKDQPIVYKSVLSHCEIPLPSRPMKYTSVPNALKGEGVWAACGINEKNVGMTATETITSNARVLGADPLVVYKPAAGGKKAVAGGIGEEDLVSIVLPYIKTAREGVERLGSLLENFGTYEMNGIAFSDVNEIWWFESVGGHHWIAKRVPDDMYVVMPNQLGIDEFDLKDALGAQKNYMCSKDMKSFIENAHLDISTDGKFNARAAFGSHDDSDHIYNTPRAWVAERYLNPRTYKWDGEGADFNPENDDIPWCLKPEKKITVEDITRILADHFQGTPYDPYRKSSDVKYRPIGVNRTDFMGLVQIRPYASNDARGLEWISFGSGVFNVTVPFYSAGTVVPKYLANTTDTVSTDNFYWASRIIGALADPHFARTEIHIERYKDKVAARSHEIINKYDAMKKFDPDEANAELAAMVKEETDKALANVLKESSNCMKNSFARSDA